MFSLKPSARSAAKRSSPSAAVIAAKSASRSARSTGEKVWETPR